MNFVLSITMNKDSQEYKFLESLSEIKDVYEYVEKWMNCKYFDYAKVNELCKITDLIGFNNGVSLLGGILHWMQNWVMEQSDISDQSDISVERKKGLSIFSLVTLQTCQRIKYLIDLYNIDSKPVHVVYLGCGTGVNGLILQKYLKCELTLIDNNSREISTNAEIVKGDFYEKTDFNKPNHFNICFMCWLDGSPKIDAVYDLLFCIGETPGGCTGFIESDANYKVDINASLSISSAVYRDLPSTNRDYIGILKNIERKHKTLKFNRNYNVDTLIDKFNLSIETPEDRKIREEMEIAGEIERDRRMEKNEIELDDDCDYKPEPDDLYQ